MMELIHKSELLIAQHAAPGFVEHLNILPADHYFAAGCSVQTAQQMQ